MNPLKVLALLLTLFALAAFQAAAQADDDDVVKVDSSIVVLNAAITDRSGNSVAGIKQDQFHIFEDGAEQPISLFQTQEAPFTAVILLDTSGSMEPRISLARSAAIKFLEGMRGEDTAAIFTFDSKVKLLQDFSASKDVSEKVFDIKADGMTVLNDAVRHAANLLAGRSENRKAMIVLSDGEDTNSKATAEKALRAALAADVVIYTVDMSGVDTGSRQRIQNQGVLKNFAEKTGGSFVAASGGAGMRQAFAKIVNELSTQYTVGYQPSNTKRDGKWRAIEVRVSRPNLTIRTRRGYNAPRDSK
jgi:Ca-activated chloride channel family protein